MAEEEKQEPTFSQAVWTWVKKTGRWLATGIPALVVVIIAIVLVVIGIKNIQIGGLLDKLLGREKKKGVPSVDVANSVPENRVDENGKIIPPGSPDSHGVTQAVVVPIKPPGIFDDPTKVEIVPPGEDQKPIIIDLPDGVKAGDVDKVIVVKPDVFAVTVKDNSGISAQTVDDLLKRYGK